MTPPPALLLAGERYDSSVRASMGDRLRDPYSRLAGISGTRPVVGDVRMGRPGATST